MLGSMHYWPPKRFLTAETRRPTQREFSDNIGHGSGVSWREAGMKAIIQAGMVMLSLLTDIAQAWSDKSVRTFECRTSDFSILFDKETQSPRYPIWGFGSNTTIKISEDGTATIFWQSNNKANTTNWDMRWEKRMTGGPKPWIESFIFDVGWDKNDPFKLSFYARLSVTDGLFDMVWVREGLPISVDYNITHGECAELR